jgi:hypothetical protein
VGMPLLAIFVFGSLVLSVRAWRSYDALSSQREVNVQPDKPAFTISLGGIILYPLSLELLARYTKLPFIARIGVTGAATLPVQYLSLQVLNRVRPKS